MSNYNAHETTPYGAYGEFEGYDVTSEWTAEDWAEHDAVVAAEIAEFEADREIENEFYVDFDSEPPF